jgi:hypothetical protein
MLSLASCWTGSTRHVLLSQIRQTLKVRCNQGLKVTGGSNSNILRVTLLQALVASSRHLNFLVDVSRVVNQRALTLVQRMMSCT